MRRASALGIAVLIALVAGCGQRTTTVTGKVTYQGKPVVWGNVAVVASDGISYAASINPDGTYTIDKVPVGPCKIGVNSPNPESPIGRGGGEAGAEGAVLGSRIPQDTRQKPAPGAWFEIPDKYLDPLNSGLTAEVKPNQPLDIDIP